MRHKFEPITVGDFVRFAWLPRDCEPTPIRVEDVSPNGMIFLPNHGWYQPHLLERVPQFALAKPMCKRGRGRPRKAA